MRVLYSLLFLTLCSAFQLLQAQSLPVIEPGVSQELAQFRQGILSDINYSLELDLPAGQSDQIRGSNEITFDLNDSNQPLVLDFRETADKVLSVSVNGQRSNFEFVAEHIVIPNTNLTVGTNRVSIEFIAGDSSLNRNPEFLYTLFVPDRARTAFPLFDQPNLKATSMI